MPPNPKTTSRRLHRLQAQLAEVGFALPGTINVAMNRCGKPNCACHHDPPKLHGPYITWTRKVSGKTITRRLTPEQLERYQPWFENDRRLRQLTKDLETLSLHAAEQAEGWQPNPPPPPPPTQRDR
ncbi:MAG TPA: DUF6788 family protein [Solirubrobacteraceae bacterium]|jgi:hypothetical protein|nr:DUF6788 family protein [Solirubrobacteraceae bacterium]